MKKRIGVSAKYIQKKAFWAKYNGEYVEASAKYIQKKKNAGQNIMENAQRFRQNTYKKKAFWAKYNGECVEVSAKYIQKKSILGKIQWRIHRDFGKIHTKKKMLGKIQ